MEKTDLTKLYKNYYSAKTYPELITIEDACYASIQGKGDPSGLEFTDTIQALYTTVYTHKFLAKAQGKDFIVAKLEALWWFDEHRYSHITMEKAPLKIPRAEWEYRLLIRLPEHTSEKALETAQQQAFEKKKYEGIKRIAFYRIPGGKVLQMLHKGPFDQEPETLLLMNQFIKDHGLLKNGPHHEIYLSDFRKTVPQKLRTILREPVK